VTHSVSDNVTNSPGGVFDNVRNSPPTKAVAQAVERGEAYYDHKEAERIVTFAHKYIIPQFIKGKFQLLPWQETWLRTLYGWRGKDGGKLFKRALLHVAKKQGKTLLVSIVSLFELYNQDTPSPLVCSASTSRENAGQIFKELANTIRRNDKTLGALAKITASNKKIRLEKRNALYAAISCDSGSAEGLNLSACIVDEAHAHRSAKLFQSLEYSTIARPDASLIVISTAGNDLGHFYYSIYTKGKRVLAGDDLDPTFYPTIFEITEGKDIEDPENWHLANPSIGVSFTQDAFQADLTAAKSDTASWLSFCRYRLNRWVAGSDEAAFDVLKWDGCKKLVAERDLLPNPAYIGVDLSQAVDPSSVSIVHILPDKRYHVQSWAWVAEEGMRRRELCNLPRYQQFQHDGYLTVSEGDMIDVALLKAKILELANRYHVRGVVFDQYSAYVLANETAQAGLTVWRSPQSFRYMTTPIKELAQAVAESRLSHNGNSWLRWCIGCSRLETNSMGDCRLHREKSSDHIDGAVSLVMALGQALQEAQQTMYPRRSRYDDNDLMVV
jgi:phage terminase large subunit-like protein